jgi:uncharacterized peroxidase-related enzyme
MPRITQIDPELATGRTRELFDSARKQMGGVPNLLRAMGHSPAVLEAYLVFAGTMAKGVLPAPLREQLAIAVAGANGCDYCASAHSFLGQRAGLAPQETEQNLYGRATDPKAAAALAFARNTVRQRGRVTDSDLVALAEAGFDSGEIVEIVGHIALNTFTNYFNHIVETEVDFPLVVTAPARVA